LALMACWRLASPGSTSRAVVDFSGVLAKDIPQLDCFSQPSIAAAVLQREAERSFSDALQAAALEEVTRHEPSTVMPPAHTVQAKSVFERPNNGSAGVVAAIKEVEALHSSVARLKGDLDRKLMVLYARNGMTTNFLNRYLNLLRKRPTATSSYGHAMHWNVRNNAIGNRRSWTPCI